MVYLELSAAIQNIANHVSTLHFCLHFISCNLVEVCVLDLVALNAYIHYFVFTIFELEGKNTIVLQHAHMYKACCFFALPHHGRTDLGFSHELKNNLNILKVFLITRIGP